MPLLETAPRSSHSITPRSRLERPRPTWFEPHVAWAPEAARRWVRWWLHGMWKRRGGATGHRGDVAAQIRPTATARKPVAGEGHPGPLMTNHPAEQLNHRATPPKRTLGSAGVFEKRWLPRIGPRLPQVVRGRSLGARAAMRHRLRCTPRRSLSRADRSSSPTDAGRSPVPIHAGWGSSRAGTLRSPTGRRPAAPPAPRRPRSSRARAG